MLKVAVTRFRVRRHQGGMYHKYKPPTFPTPAPAIGDGKYAIRSEPLASSRIKRFYYYQLRGDTTFDSGLVDAADQARPLYDYYKSYASQP